MRTRPFLILVPLLVAYACGSNDNMVASRPEFGAIAGKSNQGSGGTAEASGGASAGREASRGGASPSGGSPARGGGTSGGDAATGGDNQLAGSAGVTGDAGSDTGGGTGGSNATGGRPATGGAATGGAATGGGPSGVGGSGGVPASPCEDNLDCIIRPASCCGSCGVAVRGDVIAVNREDTTVHDEQCANALCPACAGVQDLNLVATCNNGFCAVVDLLEHELTECSVASDCRLRTSACCECGGEDDPLLVVNRNSSVRYEELACNQDSVCAACLPQYPATPIDCVDARCRIVP